MTATPCVCGRVVAYRYKVQRLHGGGKPRVLHNCPHGVLCAAGRGTAAAGGFNRNLNCPLCLTTPKAVSR